jgi:cytochrome c-type biogenesis protein CcmH
MIFALILLFVTLAVLAAVLSPLIGIGGPAPDRARFDRAVYRDQLAEIERDVARGVVAPTDADATRREIERRLLRAETRDEAVRKPAAKPHKPLVLALGLAGAVMAAAFLLYAQLGDPGLRDEPFRGRVAPIAQQEMIRSMVDGLAARLQANPDDLEGWLMLGRSEAVMGDNAKAADAYEHARNLRPEDPSIALDEVEALLADRKLEDTLTEREIALLKRIEVLNPQQPLALWFLGMNAAQQRQFDQARKYWTRLLSVMPSGAPERETVSAALAAINGKR